MTDKPEVLIRLVKLADDDLFTDRPIMGSHLKLNFI